jgi:hypothetical protein
MCRQSNYNTAGNRAEGADIGVVDGRTRLNIAEDPQATATQGSILEQNGIPPEIAFPVGRRTRVDHGCGKTPS